MVLLTNLRNDTKESIFLGNHIGFEDTTEQSARFEVAVEDDETVIKMLKQMRRNAEDLSDPRIRREATLLSGSQLVIFGSLKREQQGLMLLIGLERVRFTPLFPAARWEQNFLAKDEQDLRKVVQAAAEWVRNRAGELPTDPGYKNRPMREITTGSWQALRLLNEANTMIAQDDYKSAERLLRDTLEEDPDFPTAHMRLADILISMRRDNEGLREWQNAIGAIQNRERSTETLTDRENLRIQGQYYEDTGDYAAAQDVFED